jgi:hypothetical protein
LELDQIMFLLPIGELELCPGRGVTTLQRVFTYLVDGHGGVCDFHTIDSNRATVNTSPTLILTSSDLSANEKVNER